MTKDCPEECQECDLKCSFSVDDHEIHACKKHAQPVLKDNLDKLDQGNEVQEIEDDHPNCHWHGRKKCADNAVGHKAHRCGPCLRRLKKRMGKRDD